MKKQRTSNVLVVLVLCAIFAAYGYVSTDQYNDEIKQHNTEIKMQRVKSAQWAESAQSEHPIASVIGGRP